MLTAIREAEIITPMPIKLMFGVTPVDAEFVDIDLIDVFAPQPRWDEPGLDEVLEARCSAL